jgi:hypothetical protein
MSIQHGVVLGCPRSGTTYLMSVLNAVPEFECVNGTLLPVAVPHVVNRDLDPDVYDALAVGFERAIDAYRHSGRYHSRAAALQDWMRTPTGLGGLLRALKGERELPSRFVYKEPFLGFAPGFVLDALPDSKIVHIVRDGRDCANSLRTTYDVLTDEKLTDLKGSEMRVGRTYDHRYVPWWVESGRDQEFIDSSPYVRAMWMWKEMVRRCHDSFTAPSVQQSDQVLVVHYEEFMRRPEQVGTAILDHFGATPNASVHRRLEQAHTASIGKHRDRAPRAIRAAERLAEEELRLYGYALQTDQSRATAEH